MPGQGRPTITRISLFILRLMSCLANDNTAHCIVLLLYQLLPFPSPIPLPLTISPWSSLYSCIQDMYRPVNQAARITLWTTRSVGRVTEFMKTQRWTLFVLYEEQYQIANVCLGRSKYIVTIDFCPTHSLMFKNKTTYLYLHLSDVQKENNISIPLLVWCSKTKQHIFTFTCLIQSSLHFTSWQRSCANLGHYCKILILCWNWKSYV